MEVSARQRHRPFLSVSFAGEGLDSQRWGQKEGSRGHLSGKLGLFIPCSVVMQDVLTIECLLNT